MNNRLAIVMPVYNEEESVGKVFDEWLPVLERLKIEFCFLAYDDGSSDHTLEILKNYETQWPGKIKALSHENRGHGQTCLSGYRYAIQNNFEFILQIDSDGQCDAQYFEEFWNNREDSPVMGFRNIREDGKSRWWISRIVSFVGFLGTGIWVKDANVPYRLFYAEQIKGFIDSIPSDFHLANILVSLKLRQKNKIKWINIRFRDRFGGTASVKAFNFAEQGFRLLKQLWTS